MVVSILQNLSHRYSSHNSNIKCVDSTIKCIGFESFHYVINLDVFHPLGFLAILIICLYRCIASSKEGREGVQGSSHCMNKFVKEQIIIMYCKVHICKEKALSVPKKY